MRWVLSAPFRRGEHWGSEVQRRFQRLPQCKVVLDESTLLTCFQGGGRAGVGWHVVEPASVTGICPSSLGTNDHPCQLLSSSLPAPSSPQYTRSYRCTGNQETGLSKGCLRAELRPQGPAARGTSGLQW